VHEVAEATLQGRIRAGDLADLAQVRQEPQTSLTPSLRRAPPGQYTGTRQAYSKGEATLGFDAV
jgi:hypothetical protein